MLSFFKSSRPNSMKMEIGFLFTLITGITLMVMCSVVYWILINTMHIELDSELKLKAEAVHHMIRAYVDVRGDNTDSLKYAVTKSINDTGSNKRWWQFGFERRWAQLLDNFDLENVYINFVSDNRASLFRSKNMDKDLTDAFSRNVRFPKPGEDAYINLQHHHKYYRVANMAFQLREGPISVIQVGRSIQPGAFFLENFIRTLMLLIPVILLLTYFAAYSLSSRIIRPVEEIITTARTISDRDLGARVQTDVYYKEMRTLANAFNDMIARLEKSFRHIEEFSSQVAHELKTPLTIIKGETELSLIEPRSTGEYRQAMRVNLEETERMLRIINDLLYLSKIDYNPAIFQMATVPFCSFLQKLCQQLSILAESKSIQMNLHCPFSKKPVRDEVIKDDIFVHADELHLSRLFMNVIDNALKFTPEAGRVDIRVSITSRQVMTSIEDTGCGISEKHLSRIFDRFYRGHQKTGGNGLGLNIAQSLAKVHGGHVHVSSLKGTGTTFIITLPRLQESSLKQHQVVSVSTS